MLELKYLDKSYTIKNKEIFFKWCVKNNNYHFLTKKMFLVNFIGQKVIIDCDEISYETTYFPVEYSLGNFKIKTTPKRDNTLILTINDYINSVANRIYEHFSECANSKFDIEIVSNDTIQNFYGCYISEIFNSKGYMDSEGDYDKSPCTIKISVDN